MDNGQSRVAHRDDIDRARRRCSCSTCHAQLANGAKYSLCSHSAGSISHDSYDDFINKGVRLGHLHRCSGTLWPMGRVMHNGNNISAGEYYPIPLEQRTKKAENCPCGANRRQRTGYVIPATTRIYTTITPNTTIYGIYRQY